MTSSSLRPCAPNWRNWSRWPGRAPRAIRWPAPGLGAAEAELADWQLRWENFNRELGAAGQSAEVESARIEQLESQSHRLQACRPTRLALEREALAECAGRFAAGGPG